MGFLTGKRALIVGLISRHSIAHGIAMAMKREGAELAFSYQNEKVADRVHKMAEEDFSSKYCIACDVSKDSEIEGLLNSLRGYWDGLDILVHSVAYAPKDQLEGDFVDRTNREGFRIAHEVSSYSFTALAKAARPLMIGRSASLLTLSYLGADRAVPHYNVMGLAKASLQANVRYMASSLGPDRIRVNAISAGPIRTLAASGIQGFRDMLTFHEKSAPLRELTTIEQVGNVAAFLCSNLALGVTGEVLHVDGGFHAITPMA